MDFIESFRIFHIIYYVHLWQMVIDITCDTHGKCST